MEDYKTIYEIQVKKVDNGYIVSFRVPFESYTLVVNSLTKRKLKEVLCDIIDGDYYRKYIRSVEREEWAERKEWKKKVGSSGGETL